MKTVGLLGGMSWESTIPYYRLINEGVRDRLGGLHSAQLLLHSVDFHDIEACQASGEWEKAGEILAQAALGLERAGAQAIVLCTNTMHKVAHQIEARCALPFLHIADATGRAIEQAGLRKVALLGTRYTMEQDFTARGWKTGLASHRLSRMRLRVCALIRLFSMNCVLGKSSQNQNATISSRLRSWQSKARRA